MASPPDARGASLWHFSLDVYARPGVAAACLELQERGGADVNLVLALIWHANNGGGALSREAIGDGQAAVADWQARVVKPLRDVRRSLKGSDCEDRDGAESLRQKVKGLEFEAERIEQFRLAALLPTSAETEDDARSAAAENVHAYFEILGAPVDDCVAAAINSVLDAAISGEKWQQSV